MSTDKERMARLFIRMPGFQENWEWAAKMDGVIQTVAQGIHQFPSALDILSYMGKQYQTFMMQAPLHTTQNTLFDKKHISLDDGKNYGVLRHESTIAEQTSHTRVSGPYLPYLSKVRALLARPRDWCDSNHVMREKIGSQVIDLTITVDFDFDGEKKPVEKAFIVWQHPPRDTAKKVLNHVNTLFQETLALKTQFQNPAILLKEGFRLTATMHWWLAQSLPFFNGTAGISDMFSKAVLGYLGINVSRWKEGQAPDLEALVTPLDEYVNAYPSFFEKEPTLTK